MRTLPVLPTTSIQSPTPAPTRYLHWATSHNPSAPTDAIVWASRGGGKTYLAALATAIDLIRHPGISIRLLAGSLEQAQRMFEHLCDQFDPAQHPSRASLVKGKITLRGIELKNGSNAELLAQSQTSVRGTRVQKLRCDEVDLFDPDVLAAAQMTTISKVLNGVLIPGSIEFLSTMNGPVGNMATLIDRAHQHPNTLALFKWNVLDVLQRCPTTADCHTCPIHPHCQGRAKTNPHPGHFPIKDAIAQAQRTDALTYDAEMLCNRPRPRAPVYPHFDRTVHTSTFEFDPNSAPYRFVFGLDPGYRNPSALLLAAHNPTTDSLFILDELIAPGLTVENLITKIQALSNQHIPHPHKPHHIAIDHAGTQINSHTGTSTTDLLRRAGYSVRSRPLPIAATITQVQHRLRSATNQTSLHIHSRCKHLIAAIESYRYPDNPTTHDPIKDGTHDHPNDALRNLIASLHTQPTTQSNYLD